MAEAIFGEIEGEKEIMPIAEVESTAGYDLAFMGFPVQGEGPDKKTAELLEKHCTGGRNVVLFITHASPEDAPELPHWLDKFCQAARGANIVDMFDCQGQLSKALKMFMSIMPNAKFRRWAKMDNSQGQPDEARLERARAFARNILRNFEEVPKNQEKVLSSVG